jgi:mRNA-degrading endonuclease RelE of RelBE toxin-antitoxin system
MASVFLRLVKWPAVSGAKPLRGDLQGSYRIRTGDYRVVFSLATDPSTAEPVVKVWKIGYRGAVYD